MTTKKQPHNFNGKICHWRYCRNCGLVNLKNDATQQRIKQGCTG